MPYVTTRDKTRLYVKDWGSGPPVVLLHGWPLNADTWDGVALELAEAGFRAIAYDRRGFGRSDQPWNGYDYDTLADDLAAVMAETGAIDATLVGFSMGGGEVARYMSRHEGKGVARSVLIGSVVPHMTKSADNPEGVEGETFAKMAAAIREDRAHFFRGFFKDFYGVGMIARPVSAEVLDWSLAMALQAGLRPTLAAADAFARTDFRADLASFQVPTLFLHGTADKTVPIDATSRVAAARVTGAEFIEYDGGPHGLLATHPGEIATDLLAFLGRPVEVSSGMVPGTTVI
ncbi:MAG TPA: alpha/beta hydrolase [Candidatus Eisenbacteria bacterium]